MEHNTLPRSIFDIIIKKPIRFDHYWSHLEAPKTHEGSKLGVNWEETKFFIESVVAGRLRKRIYRDLQHERIRTYGDAYWAERDEYREEAGTRKHTEEYVEMIAGICVENLLDDGVVCIHIDSCGLFSRDEDTADIIIKVVGRC